MSTYIIKNYPTYDIPNLVLDVNRKKAKHNGKVKGAFGKSKHKTK